MGRHVRPIEVFVALCGISLAIAGNLLGNLVTENVPMEWSQYALPLLAPTIVAALGIALLLGRLRPDPHGHDPRDRGRARRRVTIGLIVLDELLAAFTGVLSNAASGQLPRTLDPYALPLFALVTACVIALAIVTGRLSAGHQVTTRERFITALQKFDNDLSGKSGGEVVQIRLPLQSDSSGMPDTPGTPDTPGIPGIPGGAPASERMLSAEQSNTAAIVRAYDTARGHLLVLGQAGAGKTTLLAELAEVLLKRAQDHVHRGLPVIFDLSTWAIDRQPLEDWMAEDLGDTYHVVPSVARAWVTSGDLIPLLDGYDEVPRDARHACAQAIDAWHDRHDTMPLVVCARRTEYREQPLRQTFQGTYLVPRLRDQDIYAYLEGYAALRRAVERDAEVREVLREPLFLRLALQTYKNLPESQIPLAGNRDEWRHKLFRDYVATRLASGDDDDSRRPFPIADTERYLAWLARNMRANGLIDFQTESVQPDWLPNTRAFDRYRARTALAYGVVSGITIGLAFALARALGFDVGPRLVAMPNALAGMRAAIGANGLLVLAGLVAGLAAGLADALLIAVVYRLTRPLLSPVYHALDQHAAFSLGRESLERWSWAGAVFGAARGAMIYVLAFDLVFGPIGGGIGGVAAGVAGGLLGGAVFGIAGSRLSRVQARLWSWHAAFGAALMGVLVYLVLSMSLGMAFLVVYGLGGVAAGALVCAIGCGLVAGLAHGDEDARAAASARGANLRLAAGGLLNGLIGGLVIGLLIGLTSTLLAGRAHALAPAIACGLGGGLVIGLRRGGLIAIQRGAVAYGLLRARVVPPDLPRFLDYAAQRALLRRVGSGYRFLHVLLRDVFADSR